MLNKIKTFWHFYQNYKNQDYKQILNQYEGLKHHWELQKQEWELQNKDLKNCKKDLEETKKYLNKEENRYLVERTKEIRSIKELEIQHEHEKKVYEIKVKKQCSEEINELKIELMEKIALYSEKLNNIQKLKRK